MVKIHKSISDIPLKILKGCSPSFLKARPGMIKRDRVKDVYRTSKILSTCELLSYEILAYANLTLTRTCFPLEKDQRYTNVNDVDAKNHLRHVYILMRGK